MLIISHQTTRTNSTPHLLSGSSLKPGMEAAAASHSSRTSTSWRGWPRSLSARWLAKSCAWIWRISVLSLGIYVKGECHAIYVFRLRVLSGRQALESSEWASLRLDSSCRPIHLQMYHLPQNYPSATSVPALGYLHDKKADGGRAGDGGVPSRAVSRARFTSGGVSSGSTQPSSPMLTMASSIAWASTRSSRFFDEPSESRRWIICMRQRLGLTSLACHPLEQFPPPPSLP